MFLLKKSFLLGMLVSMSLPLFAEIERITITWNPQVCVEPCAAEIAKQLRLTRGGIAEIILNPPQGVATLRWKPRAPFSYDFLKAAVNVVGSSIRDVRVQVRGTLILTPTAVLLDSLGDGTKFVLLSPAQQSFTKNIPQRSLETHPLAPQMRLELEAAARDFCVVTVQGPLLRPTYGLYLVIEQLTVHRLAPR